MIKSRIFKPFVVILIFLAIFALTVSGCGQTNEDNNQQEDTLNNNNAANDEDREETTVPESTETVPGTSVAVYPGAKLAYNDDSFTVYSTDASLDDLYSFYTDIPEFSAIQGSRVVDHVFALETELAGIIRRVGQTIGDDEAYSEWEEEKDAAINSATAGIMFVVGIQAGSEELDNAFDLDDEIWAQLSRDSNIFYFAFLND